MTQTKFSSHPVKAPNNRHGFSLAGMAGMLALTMAMSAQIASRPAQAAIADVPLYLTSPVEPNIMFVIDDSGSMHFELMPDGLILNDARYVFPRASDVYGTSDYTNRAPTVDNNAPYNALSRSPQVNTLYYNPSITYTPWIKHDNTLYPNAAPASAYHNPEKTSAGYRNLTANNTHNISWTSCTSATACSYSTASKTFWPATYFWHNGGDIWTWGNYTKVEIKSTTASYSGHGRESRSDCTGGTCTYAQEIQNFANWYTYYRSRILAARAGIGRAFAQQGEDVRVGFGAINYTTTGIDGVSTGTVVRGVRKFTAGTNRENFFSDLYTRNIPASGTPLRSALNRVGQYYSSSDNRGPWGANPGTSDATAHLECRQSYTVLMTDGYWSGGDSYQASTSAARENVDGTSGPTITGPGSTSFTYSAVSPFTDGNGNTLADVAMYYWKNDLRTDLDNEVPTSEINPAFWQHMVTFGVGLGVTGSIDPDDAFDAIDSDPLITIAWPDTSPGTETCAGATCQARIDDLLHASVNGRGGFFSASDPNTFATELSNVLNSITDRTSSSSAVASNSTRLSSFTHLYQALFKSGDWSGQLKAYPLLADGSLGAEAWDAADVIPAHGLRNIKTWNGSTGTDFLGALGGLSADQVNYLRGDDSHEISNSTGPSDTLHVFRNRSGKLGDIINSDPHYVKSENFGYNILPGDEGTSYSTFLSGKSSRTAVIYAGANDGMLHGFDAATGQEKLAYVPNGVWPNLPLLTDPAYTHKYFVDGSPTAWDAYWGTSWKTVLVGSLGAGGKAVYALDVSNPDTFGNSNVLWEFTHTDMGYVMGNVTVARFADDNYWAVFGNGYASTNGQAMLFMVRVDDPSIMKIIPVGASGIGNGLSTPTLVDSNGDRIVDRIYAGDLKGNVWRFDVTGAISTWKSKYAASGNPAPLFQAKDSSGNVQPITSPPEVGLAPSGASGLMVYFGTGKYFETGDELTTSVQSMYGIVDSGSAFGTTGNNRDQLVLQSIIYEGEVGGNDVRVMSDNTVTYPSDKGWVIDLLTPPSTAKGERVISVPRLFGGRLLFQSIIPSLSPCDYGGASRLMQVNPATGGQPPSASFDINGDGLFNSGDQIDIGGGVMANASGVDFGVGISGGFGSPISAGGTAYVPLSGTGDGGAGGGGGLVDPPSILGSSLKSRASWRQIQ
jgi:type IV pilus assembly protein PilY1